MINPTVASHGEMWTMLMQMIPSADPIGQTECDASRAIGARTFVTRVAFTQAATLSRASGSGSEGWKTRAGKCLAKWTTCSPEPLAISRTTPVLGKTSRRTSRMKSRLRNGAGRCVFGGPQRPTNPALISRQHVDPAPAHHCTLQKRVQADTKG